MAGWNWECSARWQAGSGTAPTRAAHVGWLETATNACWETRNTVNYWSRGKKGNNYGMSVVGLRNLPRLDRQAKQFRFLIGSAGVAGTDATSSKELRLLRLLLSQPFLPPLNNNSHQPSSHRSTTVTSLPPTIQQQSPAFLPLLNNNNSHQPSSHHSTTVTSLPPAAQQSPAYLPPFNNSHQPSSHRSTAVTSLPPAAQQQQSPAFLPLLNNTVTSLPPAVQQQPNHQPSSRGSITTQSQPSSRSTTVTSLPPTVPQQSPAFLPLLNNNPIISLPPAAQQQPNHQTSSAAQQQQSPAFLPLLNNNSHQPSSRRSTTTQSPAFLPPFNNNTVTYGSGRQQLNWQRLGHVA